MTNHEDTIRKLAAVANDSGATEGEVAAALGRMSALARKHGLSDATVERIVRETGSDGVRINVDPESMVCEEIYDAANLDRWARYAGRIAAQVAGCRTYYVSGRHYRASITAYGLPADVAVAKMLMPWLRKQSLADRRRWCRENYVQPSSVEGRSFLDGWFYGLSQKVKAELRRAREDRDEKVRLDVQNDESCTALVTVGDYDEARSAALDVYAETKLSLVKGRSPRATSYSRSGYEAGRAAGSSRNLSRAQV